MDARSKLRLSLRINYASGEIEERHVSYTPTYVGWQFVAVPFAPNPMYAGPAVATLTFDFSYTTGTFYFKDPRLINMDGIVTTNAYYKKGNFAVLSVLDGPGQQIKRKTTTNNGVLSTIQYVRLDSDVILIEEHPKAGNILSTYLEYNGHHCLIKQKDYRGIITEYAYDTRGNCKEQKTYHQNDSTSYFVTKYTYDSQNRLTSQTAPRLLDANTGEELKTVYEYDTNRNLLLRRTDPNGQVYTYTYDEANDELQKLASIVNGTEHANELAYMHGYTTNLKHNESPFRFTFDPLGRSKEVKAPNGNTLFTVAYPDVNAVDDPVETTYASGETTRVYTDIFGNVTSTSYTDKEGNKRGISEVHYYVDGKISTFVDKEGTTWYNYLYNEDGNTENLRITDMLSSKEINVDYTYNVLKQVATKTYRNDDGTTQTYRPIYEYNVPNPQMIGVTLDGKFTEQASLDPFKRVKEKTLTVGESTLLNDRYSYLNTSVSGSTVQTNLIAGIATTVNGATGSSLSYTYNKAGNIKTVSKNGTLLAKYHYDGLNRLVREDNVTSGKSCVWEYDVGGNITAQKTYPLSTTNALGTLQNTISYTYGNAWKDQLTSYNGQVIEYDVLGNPTTYRGNNLTWTKVSKLASFGNNTFKYNASGIRFKKNNTVYTLEGNKILKEIDGSKTLTYYYGVNGVVGFNYNKKDYFYCKNLQGDIVSIYRADGTKVAEYAYNAWGKILKVTNYTDDNIGTINPIRYRGYYYDTETNLYYLETRYYDPETGRFISADNTKYLEPEVISGLNLYAYCYNNPVIYRDSTGNSAEVVGVILIGALIGLISGVTFAAFDYAIKLKTDEEFSWRKFGAKVAEGAVSGTISGAFSSGGILGGAIGGFLGGLSGSLTESLFLGEDLSSFTEWSGIITDAVFGAAGGALGGLIAGPVGAPAATIVAQYSKHPIKQAVSDIIETLLMDFTTWLSQIAFEGTTGLLE